MVEDGKIINKLTGENFSVFVLPLTEMIPERVVVLLNEFTSQGGKVITYNSEIKCVVEKSGEHFRKKKMTSLNTEKFVELKKISDIVAECLQSIDLPFEIIQGVDEVSRTLSSYPARLIDPYIHDGEQMYGIGVTRYIKEDKRILNFTNYNEKDEELIVKVISTTIPEIYIPETGKIIQVEDYQNEDEEYEFSFILAKNRTHFIVCGT